MSKLRYGPRFKPTIADARYSYDEAADRMHRKDTARLTAILSNRPLYKKQLSGEKSSAANKKRRLAKEPAIKAREQAEAVVEQAIRQAVTALEFHLTALMECPTPQTQYHVRINQLQLINAVVRLKTKCGVAFDSREFSKPVSLDVASVPMPVTQVDKDFHELTASVRKRERAIQDRKLALDAIKQRETP